MAERTYAELRTNLSSASGYALIKAGLPLVHRIAVSGGTEGASEVSLRISSAPPFIVSREIFLGDIQPSADIEIPADAIKASERFLTGLQDKMTGTVSFVLSSRGETLSVRENVVELYPADIWPGIDVCAESIAAYAAPDDPAVRALCSSADDGGAEAIYDILSGLSLDILPSDDDFAHNGCRLRPPEEIIKSRRANIAELALLYCACIERMGGSPVLVLLSDGVLAGEFVGPHTGVPASGDIPAVRQAYGSGMHLIDISSFAEGKASSEASDDASRRISDSDDLVCIIDIKAARDSGIRPVYGAVPVRRGAGAADEEPARVNAVQIWENELSSLVLSCGDESRSRFDALLRRDRDMYRAILRDFRAHKDVFGNSPVLSALMDGRVFGDESLSSEQDRDVLFPLKADAVQEEAVRAACAGRSFIISGPPGTGRTETAANIIANAAASGKRVLYLSGKDSLLKDVYARLDEAGLGDFCLGLYCDAAAAHIRDDLRRGFLPREGKRPAELDALLEEYDAAAFALDGYALAVNEARPCGMSVFSLISAYEETESPFAINYGADFVRSVRRGDIELAGEKLLRLAEAGEEAGHPHGHHLTGINCRDYTVNIRERARDAIDGAIIYAGRASAAFDVYSDAIGLRTDRSAYSVGRLYLAAVYAAKLSRFPERWLRCRDTDGITGSAHRLLGAVESAAVSRRALLEKYNENFLRLDGRELADALSAAGGMRMAARRRERARIAKLIDSYSLAGRTERDTAESAAAALADYQSHMRVIDEEYAVCGEFLGELFAELDTDTHAVSELLDDFLAVEAELKTVMPDTYSVRRVYADTPDVYAAAAEYAEAEETRRAQWNETCRLLLIDEDGLDFSSGYYGGIIAACRRWLTGLYMLREWIAYNQAKHEALSAGLKDAVAAYESGIESGALLPAAMKSLYRALVNDAIDNDPALAGFSVDGYEALRERFRALDGELAPLVRRDIYARACAANPGADASAPEDTDEGMLYRILSDDESGNDMQSVLSRFAATVQSLFPCVLATPYTAALYLSGGYSFDTVIIRESSGISLPEAAAAISRGMSAVMIGDADVPACGGTGIIESFSALHMPVIRLQYLYGGRESLFAFSARRFYRGVDAFPEADAKPAVRFIKTQDPSCGLRYSRVEADTVASEIKRRLTLDPNGSIGVIAFSPEQRELIRETVGGLFEAEPVLSDAASVGEPLFIDTAENVRGDMRDCIIISVGILPEADGKAPADMGNISRGGAALIADAVSCARREITVLSPLDADMIDLTRSRSEGAAVLREYIEYAADGVLPPAHERPAESSAIARSAAGMLTRYGCTAITDAGMPYTGIDAAAAVPSDGKMRMLAICTDGPGFMAEGSARDRELYHPDILRGLGWELHNIRSIEWYTDREKAAAGLSVHAERLSYGIRRDAPVSGSYESVRREAYRAADIALVPISPREFMSPANREMLLGRIEIIIRAESPIMFPLLVRRLMKGFGLSRAGAKMQNYIKTLADGLGFISKTQDGTAVYWAADPALYDKYRFVSGSDDRRGAENIPAEEAANAMLHVLGDLRVMPAEALMREASKRMGYSRMGPVLEKIMRFALAYAEQRKMAMIIDGHVHII